MDSSRALLLAALFSLTTLAGCSGSSGNSGNGAYDITPPASPGGAYLFEAKVKADNYTWDLGDHLTTAYGESVSHVYDFTNGKINVVLHARTGKDMKDYSQALTLGTGVNEKPTFILESQMNWTITGESVKFSASRSRDPEGDPLRYSWSCNRFGDAKRQGGHTHGNFGIPFASAPAGSVTSGLAIGAMPVADQVYTGNFCDALGTGTPLSKHATTIQGTFTQSGIYDIYLIAADPVHPTTSGAFRIYVTPPSERPPPSETFWINRTLQGGVGGSAQTICDQEPLNAGDCDMVSERILLPIGGVGGSVTFDFGSGGPADAAIIVSYQVFSDTHIVVEGNSPGTKTFGNTYLKLATGATTVPLDVVLKLDHGVNVPFTFGLTIAYDRDPMKVYN